MFDEGGVRFLAVATAHRDVHDPAHEVTSWFTAATDGAVRGLDDAVVFQLHGFGAGHTDAPLVLSDGPTNLAHERLVSFGDRVAEAVGAPGWRTGDEVPGLAATRNAQGRLIAERAVSGCGTTSARVGAW
jgi:hypothetical protein